MTTFILHQNSSIKQQSPQTDNLISTEKIAHYCASLQDEVNHLEEELQRKRIILGLYQNWLDQRVREGEK